jgi:DNA-nicking Smr family endonuclease
MSGRRRRLSPEDRALWDQVKASATPLRPEGDQPPPPPPPLPPAARPPRSVPPRPPLVAAAPADPHAALARANPHMDRRRFEKLRRGRFEPEARLDLHGLDSARAHAALTRFIEGAEAHGLRLVLVITGKGRPPGEAAPVLQRHGILRHSLPHWLAAPPLGPRILQVAPAHARHGGAGAYYVYLRRRR